MSLSDLFKGLLFTHGYVNIADPDAVARLAARPSCSPVATPRPRPEHAAGAEVPAHHQETCHAS